MWPFGKGGGGKAQNIPTQKVMSLSSQGVPETQIINTLKNEGYTPVEVDAAMREALKSSAAGRAPQQGIVRQRQSYAQQQPPPGIGAPPQDTEVPPMMRNSQPDLAMPPLPGEEGFDQVGQQPPPQQQAPPYQQQPPPYQQQGYSQQPQDQYAAQEPPMDYEQNQGYQERDPIPHLSEPRSRRERREERRQAMEEMVEGVVDEKWNQFSSQLTDIQNHFTDLENRVNGLEQRLKQFSDEKRSDISAIEDKIDTYKQSMHEVTSKMDAVEGAMKNSLTPMMQAMRSLTESVKEIKEKKK